MSWEELEDFAKMVRLDALSRASETKLSEPICVFLVVTPTSATSVVAGRGRDLEMSADDFVQRHGTPATFALFQRKNGV